MSRSCDPYIWLPFADPAGRDQRLGGALECLLLGLLIACGDAALIAIAPPQVLGDASGAGRDMVAGRRTSGLVDGLAKQLQRALLRGWQLAFGRGGGGAGLLFLDDARGDGAAVAVDSEFDLPEREGSAPSVA